MDSYLYVMTALLPIAASMVVFQVNPYHALVIGGILGAIAALVYTVLGAADVALTEALVGTLLALRSVQWRYDRRLFFGWALLMELIQPSSFRKSGRSYAEFLVSGICGSNWCCIRVMRSCSKP